MRNIDGLFSWLLLAGIGAAAIVFSVYVFAFLLPFVLLFLGVSVLANLARYWYARYHVKKRVESFSRQGRSRQRPESAGTVIDVEYEVVDDGYKSKRSE